MTLADFHFLRPWWLLALPAVIAIPRLWQCYRPVGDWTRVCDPALLPHLLTRPDSPSLNSRSGFRTLRLRHLPELALLLAIAALAGPAWERLPQPVFRQQSALVIALDLSQSMDAADIRPSRLERARFKVADILQQRHEGQTALLAFAGEAHAVSPLTDDAQTLLGQLPVLTTDLMPEQGSRPSRALHLADQLLRQANVRHAKVLLVTDGIATEDLEALRELARDYPHAVAVLGVGTAGGAPVPSDSGFLRDREGKVVIAPLTEAPLRALATATDGIYVGIHNDEADTRLLLDWDARTSGAAEFARRDFTSDQWRDEGAWLLLPLLPLAALVFRRGLIVGLLIGIVGWPRPSLAVEWPQSWDEWWRRSDQVAAGAFGREEHLHAAELFRDPAWRAAALYRSRQYAAAAATLAGQSAADDHYNRGNALARSGDYPAAVAAYDEALQRDPAHDDARFNRDLVRQQLESRQQPRENAENREGRSGNGDDQGRQAGQGRGSREPASGGDALATSPAGQTAGAAPTPPPQGADRESDSGGATRRQAPDRDQGAGENSTPSRSAPSAAGEPATGASGPKPPDTAQANEQWLRRIPDDPGGLLRRKFLHQYLRRERSAAAVQAW